MHTGKLRNKERFSNESVSQLAIRGSGTEPHSLFPESVNIWLTASNANNGLGKALWYRCQEPLNEQGQRSNRKVDLQG